MGPTTPGVSQQRIKSVDTAKKTVTLTDPTGKETVVNQTAIQTDPKDPSGRTLQTTAAPGEKLKPGTTVNVKATETVDSIRRLAGL